MALNEQDIKTIEQIVEKGIEKGNVTVVKTLRGEIKASADGLRGEIKASEERIINIIGREIEDLAEINQAFIAKHDDHDRRIKRLEIKTGLL